MLPTKRIRNYKGCNYLWSPKKSEQSPNAIIDLILLSLIAFHSELAHVKYRTPEVLNKKSLSLTQNATAHLKVRSYKEICRRCFNNISIKHEPRCLLPAPKQHASQVALRCLLLPQTPGLSFIIPIYT